jgi:stage V sporulation protein B
MSNNIAKSALWVTFSEILFNLSGFVIHSVVGRMLGPADYGRYGIIITLTTMVIILIGNGIPTAMSKYISEIYDTNPRMVRLIKKQSIILQTIIIGVITIIFFFLAPVIARALNDPTLTPLFRISTWIIPTFAMASFYFSYYTGLHEFNIQSLLKILRSIFKVIFIIGLAYLYRVPGSINGYTISTIALFVIGYLIDRFKIAPKLKAKELELQCHSERSEESLNNSVSHIHSGSFANAQDDQIFDWRKLVTYAWQIVIFFLAYELLISIDLYMVKGILRDDNLTGIYNAALTVGRIPYYIFYAMTIFLLPMVSRSTSQNNHEETKKILGQAMRIMLILLVPMIVLISIYAKPILIDFYGAKYSAGAFPMSILEYGVGFLTIFYVMSFALNGAGKTKLVMNISIVGFIINAILNYILIKRYSITGSAIATSITSFIIMIWMLYYLWKNFGALIEFKSLLKTTFAAGIMYLASLLFSKGEISFIFWSIILFGLYLAILLAVREIKKEDLHILKELISRKKAVEVEEQMPGNEPSA